MLTLLEHGHERRLELGFGAQFQLRRLQLVYGHAVLPCLIDGEAERPDVEP